MAHALSIDDRDDDEHGARARSARPPGTELVEFNALLAGSEHFGHLWGRAPTMLRLYQQISRVANTHVSVFISGESGTGKELVAQTVHDLSPRRHKPFLAVNCGAISPQLIESEIFGHEKGSFTGAERQHQGFFERADGGTLFLDEITEMPLDLQVKLLRVLETGRFMRVGSTQSLAADVRMIAASNRPLQQAVTGGRLREDLLYRLNVFPLELPPLRERLSDVPLLATHFLAEISTREGTAKHFRPAALQVLSAYAWPGNVRELRNAVQRAYVMTAGAWVDEVWLPRPPMQAVDGRGAAASSSSFLEASSLPTGGFRGLATAALPGPALANITLPIGSTMAEVERTVILATLRHYKHHKERTAAALGISLKTLYNRLKEYAQAVNNAPPPNSGRRLSDRLGAAADGHAGDGR